jgi:hypothetical protein
MQHTHDAVSDLLGFGGSKQVEAAILWMPLDQHTGNFPAKDDRVVYWRAPSRLEKVDLLKDGELIVVEQAQMLFRCANEQTLPSRLAGAQNELSVLHSRLMLLVTQESDDAGEFAAIQRKVELAARELRVLGAQHAAMETRAAELHAERTHLLSLLEQQ